MVISPVTACRKKRRNVIRQPSEGRALDQASHIDAWPYLGTGKPDLRKVREFAGERSAEHC